MPDPQPRKTRRWKSSRTAGDRIAVTLPSGETVTIDVLAVWNGRVSVAVIVPDGARVNAGQNYFDNSAQQLLTTVNRSLE